MFALILSIGLIACEEETESRGENSSRTLDYRATIYFISGETDTVTTIEAAVADTDASRSAGLMDVHDMPADNGMLFIFDDEEPRSFWMANTPLALDIIFADADGEIIRIHTNTRPYSDRNIESEQPAKYVVETNAGYTLRHDIQEGMRIDYVY